MSAENRLTDLTAAQDLDFLASVVAGTWGKKAQAEALADMSGGDAGITEALSAAYALGGVRALGAALAFRADRLGRVCSSYVRDLDFVSEAAVLEAGLSLARAGEIAAAYALGGWRAVADLLVGAEPAQGILNG